MKLTLYDLNVIIDTLVGTQSLEDGGRLFKYTAEGRRAVALKLIDETTKVELELDVKE